MMLFTNAHFIMCRDKPDDMGDAADQPGGTEDTGVGGWVIVRFDTTAKKSTQKLFYGVVSIAFSFSI